MRWISHRLFYAASDAFDYSRECNKPVVVFIDDLAFKMYGKFKLYPSGKADKLSEVIPIAMRSGSVPTERKLS